MKEKAIGPWIQRPYVECWDYPFSPHEMIDVILKDGMRSRGLSSKYYWWDTVGEATIIFAKKVDGNHWHTRPYVKEWKLPFDPDDEIEVMYESGYTAISRTKYFDPDKLPIVSARLVKKAPLKEKIADVKEKLTAAEALYGFMGWLSCREETVIIGSKHECSEIPILIDKFIEENNLDPISREDWNKILRHPR